MHFHLPSPPPPPPLLQHLFTDVYAGDELPQELAQQYKALQDHMAAHPEHYAGGH